MMFVMNVTDADAKQLILNCQITKGVSPDRSPKILIDEEAGTVVYNFNEKLGVGLIMLHEGCKGCYVNLSLKITTKNEKVLVANDPASVFVMTKHDGKFVHSFVAPFPLPDGDFLAFGN